MLNGTFHMMDITCKGLDILGVTSNIKEGILHTYIHSKGKIEYISMVTFVMRLTSLKPGREHCLVTTGQGHEMGLL